MNQQQVPSVTFKIRVRGTSNGDSNQFYWEDVTSQKIFEKKNVVLFALPGAFTPTCDTNHLPGYEKRYHDFKKLGIDTVACLSVNDTFVMNQWGKSLGVENIVLLPDGNGEFTRQMGMLVSKSNLGFGMRSWRYSMLVTNGFINKMFIEPGINDNHEEDPFLISDAETMVGYVSSMSSFLPPPDPRPWKKEESPWNKKEKNNETT
jgi:peroxiredoxin